MKKLLSLIICFTLLNVFCLNAVAENTSSIQGLDECLDKICLNSDTNKDVKEKIEEMHIEYLKKRVADIMTYPDYAKQKMGLILGDDEYVKSQIVDKYSLNINSGFLVSRPQSFKYVSQYVENKKFYYLLNYIPGNFIINMNEAGYGYKIYSSKGQTINDVDVNKNVFITITDEICDYINNRKNIENELKLRNEQVVYEIKIFSLKWWSFLYVKCSENEYLIRISTSDVTPEIKPYTFYSIDEVMNVFGNYRMSDTGYLREISELFFTLKPTYETEAQSLYTDGLLKGNENGLDLLKPLTRIEATAILVRAMGFENEQTSGNSYFADISSDNWGAKYANIAKDKGIAEGIGDNMFAPDDTITASQFVTLILRNLGESPDWQTAVNLFVERGLITQEQADKMDLFTRGDMAKIIYEARQNGMF